MTLIIIKFSNKANILTNCYRKDGKNMQAKKCRSVDNLSNFMKGEHS